jgi:hypothetical protein
VNSRSGAVTALAVMALLGACAGSQPATAAPPPPVAPREPGTEVKAQSNDPWPVHTRYVIDLWLHGFAMITDDTSRVPLFRRGYRDEMIVEKNKLQITTLLDTKHDSLAKFVAAHPLVTNAQFLVLQLHDWDELSQDVQAFLAAQGDPHKAHDQATAQMIFIWSQSFPGPGDRRFLAMFMNAINDESAKFYNTYWKQVELFRRPVLAAVDSEWVKVYLRRMRSFQEGTNQGRGDIILSLPLGAEGRSIMGGKRDNLIAVNFPAERADAMQAIFVIAHEAVGTIAATAVDDNTTPIQKRSGLAGKYLNSANVRGGEIVISKLAPDQVANYQAYYLTAIGATFTPGQEALAFRTQFPLPDPILEQMRHSIDAITGGI